MCVCVVSLNVHTYVHICNIVCVVMLSKVLYVLNILSVYYVCVYIFSVFIMCVCMYIMYAKYATCVCVHKMGLL